MKAFDGMHVYIKSFVYVYKFEKEWRWITMVITSLGMVCGPGYRLSGQQVHGASTSQTDAPSLNHPIHCLNSGLMQSTQSV